MVPPAAANNSLLPILVDVSRSMRLDATRDGPSRLERAQAIVRDLQAQLGKEYRLELLTFGEALAAGDGFDRLAATARRSDLERRDRRPRRAPSQRSPRRGDRVVRRRRYRAAGSRRRPHDRRAGDHRRHRQRRDAPRDREIVNLTAGEPLLPGASIDVSVSATSTGFGTEPVELRVSANGRPVEVRRVTPSADGAPVHAVFTVSPEPDVPTVYTRADSRRRPARSRPRTTAAACSCRRKPASGGCWSSKARPASSTRS